MCGIVGYFHFNSFVLQTKGIFAMSDSIAHRGSDDEGFALIDTKAENFVNLSSMVTDIKIRQKMQPINRGNYIFKHNIAMAHRRFSIIDLSHSAHQPMWTDDNRYTISFNGEIINYIELRKELENNGIRFKSLSDTEVILQGYRLWGKKIFGKLNGFWAISIYDGKRKKLILSRDRIGKKPVYYYKNDDAFIWGSEIKSIFQIINKKNFGLNGEVIYNYLVSGIKDFEHKTFFEDIKMMDNASIWEVSESGSIHKEVFWDIDNNKRIKLPNIEDISNEFGELLAEALKERLRADVPVAFELSGGLDSSTLVALRAKLIKERFSVFTVKYDDKRIDESEYAKLSVKSYGNIDHTIINFQETNLWKYFEDFIDLMEEPFHGPVLLIGQILRKIIADEGYRVIISGAGGDEVFGGYTEYAIPIIRKMLETGDYYGVFKNIIFYKEKYPLSFFPFLTLIIKKIFKYGYSNSFFDNYILMQPQTNDRLRLPKNIDELFKMNMKDLKMYYWMSSNDKSDMGIPVEVRSPFLDYNIVDFSFKLPVSVFLKNGWLKWILRYSFKDIMPREIVWRKRKQGFPFPVDKWLIKERNKIFLILKEKNNFVNNARVMEDFDLLVKKNPNFLWRLISFQMWLSFFVKEEGPYEVFK